LTDLEQTLDPTCFVRIHRRFLLQVDRLARIEMTATNSRIAVLTDGSRLPISRTGYRRLSDLIDQ
jgi:two-component system LytT family response regulator